MTHKKRPDLGPGRVQFSYADHVSIIGQRADNQSDDGPRCDGGENRISAMMVPRPVVSRWRRVEAVGVIVADIDRMLVRAIPATDMVARLVATTIIGTISPAVAHIIVTGRCIMAMRTRGRAIDMARRGAVVAARGMVAAIVMASIIVAIIIASIATIMVTAVPIVASTIVPVSPVSTAMAAIMITAAAIVIAASPFCIGLSLIHI